MKCRRLDIFGDLKAWLPVASGRAGLGLAAVREGGRTGLRMEYDFRGGGGFVVGRRLVVQDLPGAYALRLRVRLEGAANLVEVKLVDPTNQNVWRRQLKGLLPTGRWRTVVITSEEIEFAWGPQGGGALLEWRALELAVVAVEGGAGALSVSELVVEDRSFPRRPVFSCSSAARGHGAGLSLDGESGTWWAPAAGDAAPWIMLDSGEPRVLGGLIIGWQGGAPAAGYRVRGSNDGVRWRTLHEAARAAGPYSALYLPGARLRCLRVEPRGPAGVVSLEVQPFEFSRTVEAFWHELAMRAARGDFPRWLRREQSLWTPVGTPDGRRCSLLNEEGLLELDEGSFSVEPLVSIDGQLHTWAGVETRHALFHQWMPVPVVIWHGPGWRLRIEATATGETRRLTCRVEGLPATARVRLFFVIRPFQVVPPWQKFRQTGGVSRIHDLAWDGTRVAVNGTPRLLPDAPSGFGAMGFDEGSILDALRSAVMPVASRVHDALGFATGVLWFDAREASLVATTERTAPPAADHAALWREKLAACDVEGAGWAVGALRAMRTAAAHILVTRDGPALQPGPRRYTRSWVRDGTIMSAALLRMGCTAEVLEFIAWYEPHLRADGFVPCCVDRDGPDWLVEHDSHGQWLALIADAFAFTRDTRWLAQRWPGLKRVAAFIEGVLEPDGLLPISVSHEGYLAQPVHSYWDDFWALRGLRDAAALACTLGHKKEAARWQALAGKLEAGLFASIEQVRREKQLATLPASVEWADFDPTATANAIMILDAPPQLNAEAVSRTFDQYLADWRKKRSGELPWANYTPYEIRIIGALVRLGRREAALELLRFFLGQAHPPAWHQWPEIAWHDPSAPGHIGDVPHTWIGAEYVLAVQSLFVYESESTSSLVLGAGLAPEWLGGAGVRVRDLPTRHGRLDYTLRRVDETTLEFTLGGTFEMPPGGIVLRPPVAGRIRAVKAPRGCRVEFDAGSVTLCQTGVTLSLTTHAL